MVKLLKREPIDERNLLERSFWASGGSIVVFAEKEDSLESILNFKLKVIF